MHALYLFLIYSLALLTVMFIAEAAYRYLKLDTEWTRKIAHVGSGIVALTYPKYIDNHYIILALTLSFTLILYTSKKMGLFPSIFSVGRKSYGDLIFVWSTWLLFLLYQLTGNDLYFYLPFAIVVFADPLAALVGKNFPVVSYSIFQNKKSLGGSLAFFLMSFALSYYFLKPHIDNDYFIWFSLTHALILTIIEAVSIKGWDNFTIPLTSVILIYSMI